MSHPMANKMPPKMVPQLLYRWALMSPKRQYVIDKIKKPTERALVAFAKDYPKHKKFLERAMVVLVGRIPEPTMENTKVRNVARLLNIRGAFFEHFEFENESERRLFEAIWRLVIFEYEHDPYYAYRIDFILEELNAVGLSYATLLIVQDKFFEYENNPGRDALFRAIWKISLVEYGCNEKVIKWVFEEINKSGWEPRAVRQEQCWKEPMPKGWEPRPRMTTLLRR